MSSGLRDTVALVTGASSGIGAATARALADLIVLDRNLFRIPADTIAETKVLMTMVGGKVVYRSRMLGSRKNADWVIQEGAA